MVREAADQLPRPQQQILGLASRDHPGRDEPRMRGNDHQHRQQHGRAILERDPLGREPQITLGRVTLGLHQPIRRINQTMLRPQPPDIVTEPRDRPLPLDPLREHRRRHLRQQRARTLASNSENDVCCGARSYLAHAATPTHDRPLIGRSPNP